VTLAGDSGGLPAPRGYGSPVSSGQSTNLGDILERVLDKGIVIAGDIRVNLLDIELLTIKLRLVIASLDTAREVGIDWWEHDPWLSGNASKLQLENDRLRARLEALEAGDGERPAVEAQYVEFEDDR
jgi:Gas vesicle protein